MYFNIWIHQSINYLEFLSYSDSEYLNQVLKNKEI